MIKLLNRLVIGVVLLASVASLQAREYYEEMSTYQLKNIFQSEGYSYKVDEDGDIRWKLEGVNTLVIRQSEGKCLSFRVAYTNDDTTLSRINEWNKSKRYSRSYLDSDGDPVLQLDLDLEGGVTRERVIDFLKTCRISMNAWRNEVL